MTVALGGDGADELFAGYPNFMVQRFAPAMRLVPPALGQLTGQAIGRLPSGDGYMNWRFLLAQLAHGFGAATQRQSFLWMAPFDPDGHAIAVAEVGLAAGRAECRLRTDRPPGGAVGRVA